MMRVLDEVSFAAAEVTPRTPTIGDHCVTFVDGHEDAAAVACPFIADGLRAGERVLSWLPADVCERIERTLPENDRRRLRMVDGATVYAAPFDAAALIERVIEIAREDETPLRIIGGPMGDPTEVGPLSEWERYERLAHEACYSEGITGLCVWEAPTTPDDILEMVRRTHSLVHRDAAMRRNPDFVWATP